MSSPESATELPVPDAGLDYVLSTWIGRGGLVPALQSITPDGVTVDWTPGDTKIRADLVLFHEVAANIARLPARVADWIDLLPAQSVAFRDVTNAPTGTTSWIETRRRFGWPPEAFVSRSRLRVPDELLSTSLAWLAFTIVGLAGAATAVDQAVAVPVARQIRCAADLLDGPLWETQPVEPSPADLLALEREGKVWRLVAAIARRLRLLRDPAVLARNLLEPEFRAKLFHLGVLGTLLIELTGHGAQITSRSPLGGVSGREQFHVQINGERWHLWFEAGGVWSRYRTASPYRDLVSALRGQTRPLSPDLLLLRPGGHALVIECKYSAAADYIGRTGLAQANLYATELRTGIVANADAFVLVPDTVVVHPTQVVTTAGRLGIGRPSDLGEIVDAFLRSAQADDSDS